VIYYTAAVAKQLAHNRAELANQHHAGSDTGGYRKGKGSAQIQLKLKQYIFNMNMKDNTVST
jgi:hypothetical protein